MKWEDILEKFFEHFDEEVSRGIASSLSGMENIILATYTKWLEKNYMLPIKRIRSNKPIKRSKNNNA